MKTVYKVVTRENKSIFASGQGCGIEYAMGEKAVPLIRGSFLFAFGSYEEALSWLSNYNYSLLNQTGYRILKCKARETRSKRIPFIDSGFNLSEAKIRRKINMFTNKYNLVDTELLFLPRGTVCCTMIIPESEVAHGWNGRDVSVQMRRKTS